MDELSKIYYNPKSGYISLDKLYKKAKKEISDLTLKEVKKFLEEQETYQVNKQVKKPTEYNTILANKIRDNYQMDIIVYDRYTVNNYKYILCVIDVHSRYVSCRAMTNRTNETILKNIKEIFDSMGVCKNLNADNEFNTKLLTDYFNKKKIILHFSEVGEINKQAIVERFNRSLAGYLQKWRVATGKTRWYEVLPDIVENYNDTYHKTMKSTPKDIWEGKDTNKQKIKFVPNELNVGDKIRIKQVKKIFDKGDAIKYSTKIYIIESIKGQKVKLEGSDKIFKPEQLMKVENIVYLDKPPEENVKVSTKKKPSQVKAIKEISSHLKAGKYYEDLPEKRKVKPKKLE
jgi:hypothetical protein